MMRYFKKFVPKKLLSAYHYILALTGGIIYGFPSRKIFVIGITGTKGKTTTSELVNAILEEAGHKTALASTLRFKIGEKSERNMRKMTMPGRFFVQKWLSDAVEAKCKYAILEMTSEGVKQFRHKFIALDALIFTNLAPEHIESHGSYEKYVAAKLEIARTLAASRKKKRLLVVNRDDKEAERFLIIEGVEKVTYGRDDKAHFELKLKLPGEFNLYNALAAATLAEALGIPLDSIRRSLASFGGVPGRMQKIYLENGTAPFDVIVDYAHTPDSLEQVYKTIRSEKMHGASQLICVLGNTGGGRDTWKRPVMGEIAAKYCDSIFVTDEDPYDEDPRKIMEDVAKGISGKKFKIIEDRREAIREALSSASYRTQEGKDVVIITGKGTDPYIMRARGVKIPWSDAEVARDELKKLGHYAGNN
jgi:UDP-N-acetylmuramoyl-L-alanyl-D-glutamate--2,6-diaminopimelate ligase